MFLERLPRNATGKVLKRELELRRKGFERSLASLRGMAAETHDFDLAGLRLSAGEGRRLELDVPIEPLLLGRRALRGRARHACPSSSTSRG